MTVQYVRGPSGGSIGLVLVKRVGPLGGAAGSIDFSSIPAAAGDLLLYWQLRSSNGAVEDAIGCRFNSDGSQSYQDVNATLKDAGGWSSGSGGSQTDGKLGYCTGGAGDANRASIGQAIIPNYAGTSWYKEAYGSGSAFETGAQTDYTLWQAAFAWLSTVAINEITLFPESASNWAAGSVASLYRFL